MFNSLIFNMMDDNSFFLLSLGYKAMYYYEGFFLFPYDC